MSQDPPQNPLNRHQGVFKPLILRKARSRQRLLPAGRLDQVMFLQGSDGILHTFLFTWNLETGQTSYCPDVSGERNPLRRDSVETP